MASGLLFTWAWKVIPHMPSPIVRGAFDIAARIAHAARIKPVRQLERNLSRVTNISEPRRLRRVSRQGMRSYMRYFAEAFQLPKFSSEQLKARVRTINEQDYAEQMGSRTFVAGVGHFGNWDLAGAWSEQHFAHIVTVAESLEPERLFREFLRFREGLGMTIFAYTKGTGLFAELVEIAENSNALMPLLADRDLSRDGLIVDVCGHPMRVAPGPAAIAVATNQPFIGAFIRYERLYGTQRRHAGGPWGIVIEFTDPIDAPESDEPVKMMMQTWADHLGRFAGDYPQDWHMLQKCFLADLDTDRLSRAESGTFATD